jgi:hypothetical protein
MSWLEHRFEISHAIWITLVALCWIVPATVVGAVLVWQPSNSAGADNDPRALPR